MTFHSKIKNVIMLDKIKEKADEAGLVAKLITRKIEVEEGEPVERTELFIQVPNEKEFKNVILNKRNANLKEILDSNFSKFKFLKGYEAIYSIELGIIECEIQSDDFRMPYGLLLRRLSRLFKPKIKAEETQEVIIEAEETEVEEKDYSIEFPSPNEKVKIYLRESSTEFSFLCGCKRESFLSRNRLKPFLTIRIEGLSFETHSQAKELLSNIGNSVFFQIDLLTNIPVHLSSDKDLQREIRLRRKAVREDLKFVEPKFQYDSESISLYWYARIATTTPLLQYLAFYQVLEFYFPQYSAKEARERIKNLLKDPTFDRNSDKNVTKILDIVKTSAKSKAIGDERSQIRATVLNCVDLSTLTDFFNEFEERKDFFDDSKKGKSLVKQKISFNRKDHDIRLDIANRVYELRCRIVHTKEESETEILLPFSPDLTLIKFDIDLVEFIARKVLIAGCKPLELTI